MPGLINSILGTLPSGRVYPLSDDDLSKHLREHYIFNDAEADRQKAMRVRLDFYHDRYEAHINAIADTVFQSETVRELRKKFIEMALFQNVTRRIVREISAVYAEPARRTIGAANARYQDLQSAMRLDQRMRKANRYLNLCNEVLVWFRLRNGEPQLQVVPPSSFWAVCHPADPEELVAVIVDQTPVHGAPMTEPHYLVMADDGWFYLDGDGRLVPGSYMPWGSIRPWMLLHREEPEGRLIDPDSGSDLLHAHKAVALLNVMMMKHQKSGTRQAVASGDTGDMPRDQPMDEEHILQAPEGVSFQTLDLGADPANYINAARAVIKQVAANYGIPESVFDMSYQATSGFEIELKRQGLREVRSEQILAFRPTEKRLAEIMSTVLTAVGHPLAFSLGTRWRVDFGDIETPADGASKLAYWEQARRMGLINTAQMMMHLQPEISSEAQALEQIRRNAEVEAERVQLQRALNVSPSAPADGSDQQQDDEEDMQQDRGMLQ